MGDAGNSQPVGRRGFIWTHATVLLSVAVVAGSGFIAWGQTQAKVERLEQRADKLDTKLENLRQGQEQSGWLLQRLDERSMQQERMQQQILRSIQELGRRLNERDARGYGVP